MQRGGKQTIIALIFFGILGAIGYGTYIATRVPVVIVSPTPGVAIEPLEIISQDIIPVRAGDYDFVARISNPNSEHGSGEVVYDVVFLDSQQQEIGRRQGTFYILPNQTKYIVETPLRFDREITSVALSIDNVRWQKINALTIQSVDVILRNSTPFQTLNLGGIYGKVAGTVFNNSDLDLNDVDVVVIAKSASDTILGVAKTQINTFLARTSRGFETSWVVQFSDEPSDVVVEIGTNIFADSNFIGRFGTQEQFQQFY